MAVVLALATGMTLASPGAGGGRPIESAAQWNAGPASWLLQKRERRQLKKIRTEEEMELFLETFWRRRDPKPHEPGNSFAEQYRQRIEEADLLFHEEGSRGSLSDRGGALLLLGPPLAMHRGPRSALSVAFTQANESDHRALSQQTVEVWRYSVHELPLSFQEALGDRLEVELTFKVDEGRVTLLEGRWVLNAAARAAVLRGLE